MSTVTVRNRLRIHDNKVQCEILDHKRTLLRTDGKNQIRSAHHKRTLVRADGKNQIRSAH